ncbi:uncharacterized protein [Nicotiana sylvestris]|uniref:uncharacterized protein n=1 Tax=Nicotiana sylvestris TaxID=4096 RepID=UPI00388C60C4
MTDPTAVPWNYNKSVVTNKGKEISREVQENNPAVKYFNLEEVNNATRKRFPSKKPVLIKTLNEAYMPVETSVEQLERMAERYFAFNQISFSKNDLPPEGAAHNKALHLTVKCEGYYVKRVMLDGGSGVDICPLSTFQRMEITTERIRPNNVCVRAFDGIKRDTVGEIYLTLTISPVDFEVTFQVLDMDTSYNFLLGRPCIHAAGAVPSTLHKMVKFRHEDQEIMVHGEDEQSIYHDPSVPCLEAREGSEHKVYQAFEIVVPDQCEEGNPCPQPFLSNTSIMVAKEMIRHDYKSGKGLGKSLHVIAEPITLTASEKFFGVGFRPTPADVRWAYDRKNDGWVLPQPVPHMYRTFVKPKYNEEEEHKAFTTKEIEEIYGAMRKILSNNAALNNMTCLRTSCPDPNALSNCEVMNQELKYDEEEAFMEINRELDQFENKPKPNLNDPEPFNLGTSDEIRETKISIHTDEKTRDALIQLLLDPLKYIFQKPMPTGRLEKWQILLTEFDIVYVTRTTMKAQALAYHLAKNPVDDEHQPLNTYFPDEEVNSVEAISEDTHAWKMFFDGAVNAKYVGIGAILISPTGQHYPATARLRVFCTNNTAKYEACIMGMNMAIDHDVEKLLIMGYSDLIIKQAQGEWETRDVNIIPYREHVEDLGKRFKSIEFRYIPRCHNELADALATLALMLPYPGNPLEIQIRERQWHEKLSFALLGYCTTVRTSIGSTPYHLVYGTEAVIPVEVEIPSLRIIVEAEIEDIEWVKTRLEQLTLIGEKRMAAVCHGQLYQQRMARASNKKVRPRNYEVGQLVLRRILPHHQEAKGKFAPNWKGPYIIKKILPRGALYVGDIKGNDLEAAVNADVVKRYYV